MRPMSPTSMRTRYQANQGCHKAAPPFAQRKVRWARPTCLILVVSLLLDGEPSARAGGHSCDSWQAAQGNQVPQKEHASVALCIAVPCIISRKCKCILKFASIECHKFAAQFIGPNTAQRCYLPLHNPPPARDVTEGKHRACHRATVLTAVEFHPGIADASEAGK